MDGEPTTDGVTSPEPDDASPAAPGTRPDGAPPRTAEREPDDATEAGTADGAGDAPAGEAPDTGEAADQTSTSGRESRPFRVWSRPMAVAASTAVALVLGFALTVQIRSTGEPDDQVTTRQEDLVVILDELDTREEALRQQISDARQTIQDLTTGQQQSDRAVEEARARAEAIGILAGTLPASGPGVRLTVQDSDGAVPASVILGAIQELRGAGAEALEVDGVRVVVSSAVTGSPGALRIDGIPLDSPYEFHAVGPPGAMDVALNVSGGVVADVGRVGATATVRQSDVVTVDATVD